MAHNHSLLAYDVTIKKGRESLQVSDFLNTQNERSDLLDFFRHFFLSKRTLDADDYQKKAIRTTRQSFFQRSRTINGIIQSGEYGIESEIVDINNEETTHHRSKNEADMKSFFYSFFCPTNSYSAILLLQKTGIYGIKTSLWQSVSEKFEQIHNDLKLHISPFFDSTSFLTYINHGEVTSLHFIRKNATVSDDVVDRLGPAVKENQKIEVILKNPNYQQRRELLGIKRTMQANDIPDLFTVDQINIGIGINFDDVKLHIKKEGIEKSFDLSNLERAIFRIPVLEDPPTINDLTNASQTGLTDLSQSLGIAYDFGNEELPEIDLA